MPLPLLLLTTALLVTTANGMYEEERVVEHEKRYGVWPPPMVPNTTGWTHLMMERFAQVAAIEDRQERFVGWMQTVNQAFVAPNFTELGLGLVKAPLALTELLQKEIRQGIANRFTTLEHAHGSIPGMEGSPPLFLDRPDLTERVSKELQPYTEAWAGIPLAASLAYGFRIYRNESRLNMHIDKAQTHVISMIYHIDNSEDSQPWPVFMESLDGQTHEIVLLPGDVLLYESSKLLHGRPKPFVGSWYTSVFVHYYPTEGWSEDRDSEVQIGVPPSWDTVMPNNTLPPLRIVGTTVMEPTCPFGWCNSQQSIPWTAGLGEEGFWIDAKQEKHSFQPKLDDEL